MDKKSLNSENKGQKSHIVIPVKKKIDEKELTNLVASFICSHENVPINNAAISQEGNNYIVLIRKVIPDKKGKHTQVETVAVQFNFMPETCIVDFSTDIGKVENKNLKDAALVTGVAGVFSLVALPAALTLMPLVGVAVAASAVFANGKAKESRQLKDNVFALIYDYLGYDPNTQIGEIDIQNISTEENKTAEPLTQTCECGYVFKQKMQFCPECGKKVIETVEKKCECGYIISEGTKFCPQCGKSVS